MTRNKNGSMTPFFWVMYNCLRVLRETPGIQKRRPHIPRGKPYPFQRAPEIKGADAELEHFGGEATRLAGSSNGFGPTVRLFLGDRWVYIYIRKTYFLGNLPLVSLSTKPLGSRVSKQERPILRPFFYMSELENTPFGRREARHHHPAGLVLRWDFSGKQGQTHSAPTGRFDWTLRASGEMSST